MKVSELTGAQLDYWVAKAEGLEVSAVAYGHETKLYTANGMDPWAPSTDWAQGGPIIEREQIGLEAGDSPVRWCAELVHSAREDGVQRSCAAGPSALIAAMRAYVASKFGENVEQS